MINYKMFIKCELKFGLWITESFIETTSNFMIMHENQNKPQINILVQILAKTT